MEPVQPQWKSPGRWRHAPMPLRYFHPVLGFQSEQAHLNISWKCLEMLDMFLGIFITAATEGSRNAGNSPKFSRPGGPKDRRIRIQICINGNNNNQSNNQWENGKPRRRRWANQKEGEKKTGAIESLQSFLSASYILYINFSYLKGVAITRTHTIVFVFFMKRIIRRRAENKTKRGKRKREELN